VLLIDCDLRRPVVHRALGIENKVGLMTWVDSEDPLTPEMDFLTDPRLGIKEVATNFYALTSGGFTEQPTEAAGPKA